MKLNPQYLFSDTKQFCTAHQGKTDSDGGLWLTSNNGKNRRLICKGCKEIREIRLAAAKSVTEDAA